MILCSLLQNHHYTEAGYIQPLFSILASSCRVTNANKREYVNLIAQHRMTTAIRGQINAFLTGFWDLIPKVSQAA